MADGICPFCGQRHSFLLNADKCIMCNERLAIEETIDLKITDLQKKQERNKLDRVENKVKTIRKELEVIKDNTEKTRKEIDKLNIHHQELVVSLDPDRDHSENSDKKRLEKAMNERTQALKELNESKN